MFFHSRTHQIISNQAKTHMETYFLSNEPIKMNKKANEPIKTTQKANEPNKNMKRSEWTE